jgi:hypothetical protein
MHPRPLPKIIPPPDGPRLARPGAVGSGDARQILEARFAIAQMLAVEGEPDEALAELRAPCLGCEIYPRS